MLMPPWPPRPLAALPSALSLGRLTPQPSFVETRMSPLHFDVFRLAALTSLVRVPCLSLMNATCWGSVGSLMSMIRTPVMSNEQNGLLKVPSYA